MIDDIARAPRRHDVPLAASADVLTVTNLRTRVGDSATGKILVNSVSFDVRRGESFAVVGESGSGKSMLVRSIMDLLPHDIRVTDPSAVKVLGVPVLELPAREARKHWGRSIAMIFQDPKLALNPVRTIGAQLIEPIRLHLGMPKQQAKDRALSLLSEVGLTEPLRRLNQYPHELSGGMRQRVTIAMALSCNPSILIADEPTSALDVTIQRQILELLVRLQRSHGMATVLITHDIGVVAQYSDRVVVMKDGTIVEGGDVRDVLRSPQHTYTRQLIDSVPRMPVRRLDDQAAAEQGVDR